MRLAFASQTAAVNHMPLQIFDLSLDKKREALLPFQPCRSSEIGNPLVEVVELNDLCRMHCLPPLDLGSYKKGCSLRGRCNRLRTDTLRDVGIRQIRCASEDSDLPAQASR